MSDLRLGNALFDPLRRKNSLFRNERRAMIVRQHRLMQQQERPAVDHAGSPDAYLGQLPRSLVGE